MGKYDVLLRDLRDFYKGYREYVSTLEPDRSEIEYAVLEGINMAYHHTRMFAEVEEDRELFNGES